MSFIREVKSLITHLFGVMGACLSVLALEAKLAIHSVFPLIMTLFFLFIGVLSTWFTVMIMVAYGLMQLLHSTPQVLVCMLGLHALVLIILWGCLRFNLKQMGFEQTRRYLKKLRLSKGVGCEREENHHQTNCQTRPPATTSSRST